MEFGKAVDENMRSSVSSAELAAAAGVTHERVQTILDQYAEFFPWATGPGDAVYTQESLLLVRYILSQEARGKAAQAIREGVEVIQDAGISTFLETSSPALSQVAHAATPPADSSALAQAVATAVGATLAPLLQDVSRQLQHVASALERVSPESPAELGSPAPAVGPAVSPAVLLDTTSAVASEAAAAGQAEDRMEPVPEQEELAKEAILEPEAMVAEDVLEEPDLLAGRSMGDSSEFLFDAPDDGTPVLEASESDILEDENLVAEALEDEAIVEDVMVAEEVFLEDQAPEGAAAAQAPHAEELPDAQDSSMDAALEVATIDELALTMSSSGELEDIDKTMLLDESLIATELMAAEAAHDEAAPGEAGSDEAPEELAGTAHTVAAGEAGDSASFYDVDDTDVVMVGAAAEEDETILEVPELPEALYASETTEESSASPGVSDGLEADANVEVFDIEDEDLFDEELENAEALDIDVDFPPGEVVGDAAGAEPDAPIEDIAASPLESSVLETPEFEEMVEEIQETWDFEAEGEEESHSPDAEASPDGAAHPPSPALGQPLGAADSFMASGDDELDLFAADDLQLEDSQEAISEEDVADLAQALQDTFEGEAAEQWHREQNTDAADAALADDDADAGTGPEVATARSSDGVAAQLGPNEEVVLTDDISAFVPDGDEVSMDATTVFHGDVGDLLGDAMAENEDAATADALEEVQDTDAPGEDSETPLETDAAEAGQEVGVEVVDLSHSDRELSLDGTSEIPVEGLDDAGDSGVLSLEDDASSTATAKDSTAEEHWEFIMPGEAPSKSPIQLDEGEDRNRSVEAWNFELPGLDSSNTAEPWSFDLPPIDSTGTPISATTGGLGDASMEETAKGLGDPSDDEAGESFSAEETAKEIRDTGVQSVQSGAVISSRVSQDDHASATPEHQMDAALPTSPEDGEDPAAMDSTMEMTPEMLASLTQESDEAAPAIMPPPPPPSKGDEQEAAPSELEAEGSKEVIVLDGSEEAGGERSTIEFNEYNEPLEPPRTAKETRRVIWYMHKRSCPFTQIADYLSLERVPNFSGRGSWDVKDVESVVKKIDAKLKVRKQQLQQQSSGAMNELIG